MAYNTWTEGDVLYASDLNENFSLITADLNSITAGQIADDAINAGVMIDDDVITDGHLDYSDTVNGVGVLQIGKDRTTYEQMMVKGTQLITAADVTETSVEIAYANGDCATAGEPVFLEVPHIYVTAYTDMGTDGAHHLIDIVAAATDTCLVNLDIAGATTITENWTLYWMAVGNV